MAGGLHPEVFSTFRAFFLFPFHSLRFNSRIPCFSQKQIHAGLLIFFFIVFYNFLQGHICGAIADLARGFVTIKGIHN